MLGRISVKTLRPAQPYVCLPCLRQQFLRPGVAPLASIASHRIARLHSGRILYDEPTTQPLKEQDTAAAASSPQQEAGLTEAQQERRRRRNRNLLERRKKKARQRAEQVLAIAPESKTSDSTQTEQAPEPKAEGEPEPKTNDTTEAEKEPESHTSDGTPPEAEAKGNNDDPAESKAKAKNKQQSKSKAQSKDEAKQRRRELKTLRKTFKKVASADGERYDRKILKTIRKKGSSDEVKALIEATREKLAAREKVSGQSLTDFFAGVTGSSGLSDTLKKAAKKYKDPAKKVAYDESVSSLDLQLQPLDIPQPSVPNLSYGLDRVLFNPGVYHLQDPRSHIYNFDPYLQKIMPITEFNFNLLPKYITSSHDEVLSRIAREQNKKYIGSTSSMTSSLAHFHFLLSSFRPINMSMVSKGFPETADTFTRINRLPSAIFLRRKNGTYAIDADKQYDTANVLTMLGRSMERLLTLPMAEYERYRKNNTNEITEEERNKPEAYHYTTMGDMLMRSQLDARDDRLPGTGMFDLKTRAVVSIRMDISGFEEGMGYQIKSATGKFESFEREYYDMLRSTMLKYSLQARMGRMDGIFVAYHNVERIFGFQYISIDEMDQALHHVSDNSRRLGDAEFRLSVDLMNKALDKATERFPETTIRLHFETREAKEPFMYIFAEPMTEEEAQAIQNSNKAKIEEWERKVLGLEGEGFASETQEVQEFEHLIEEERDRNSDEFTVDNVAMPPVLEIERGIEPEWNILEPRAWFEANASELASEQLEKSIEGEDGEESPDSKLSLSASEKEIEDDRPLAAWKLHVRNKVDGTVVQRVTNLDPGSEWTVDYHFEELSPSLTRSNYTACKNRRKAMLESREERLEEEKVLSYYQRILRDISNSGRVWREQMDDRLKGRAKIIFKPKEEERSRLTDVDFYLSWLYGRAPSSPKEKEGANKLAQDAQPQLTDVNSYLGWLYEKAASSSKED